MFRPFSFNIKRQTFLPGERNEHPFRDVFFELAHGLNRFAASAVTCAISQLRTSSERKLSFHLRQANPHVHQQHGVLATTFRSGSPQPLSSQMVDLVERVDLLDDYDFPARTITETKFVGNKTAIYSRNRSSLCLLFVKPARLFVSFLRLSDLSHRQEQGGSMPSTQTVAPSPGATAETAVRRCESSTKEPIATNHLIAKDS